MLVYFCFYQKRIRPQPVRHSRGSGVLVLLALSRTWYGSRTGRVPRPAWLEIMSLDMLYARVYSKGRFIVWPGAMHGLLPREPPRPGHPVLPGLNLKLITRHLRSTVLGSLLSCEDWSLQGHPVDNCTRTMPPRFESPSEGTSLAKSHTYIKTSHLQEPGFRLFSSKVE